MSFKDMSYLEFWQSFCLAEQNHLICNFGRGHHEEKICEIILNLDKIFRRWLFNDNSHPELWWALCSAEPNHLCNFGRWHHEEQFM